MSEIGWIIDRLIIENMDIPDQVAAFVQRNTRRQPPLYFLDRQDAIEETTSMVRQFPTRKVIAFARRIDHDGVVCIVLSDPSYRRGQVLIVHDDAPSGFEVDDEFSSLSAWAEVAEREIDERVRMGWNRPI